MFDFDYVIQQINSQLPDNNSQFITASKLRSVLNDIVLLLEKQTGDLYEVEEDGFYICDENGYILASFTQVGFNVVQFDDSLIDYLNNTLNLNTQSVGFSDVAEDGLYITDADGYILTSFTNNGVDSAFYTQHLINYLNNTLSLAGVTYIRYSNTPFEINV